jgi:hypothetical protein
MTAWVAVSSFLFLSCSGSPPKILNTEWMIVYTYDQGRGGIYTEMDFFAQMEDEDGVEDISEISIRRDDQGWAWELTPDSWVSLTEDGETWIGANGMTLGGPLPGGDYRLLVIDRSGQREEHLFRVDDPGVAPGVYEFPRAQVQGNFIRIDAAGHDPVVLWFYNERGELVSEKYRSGGFYSRTELLEAEEEQIVSWFMIYFQDEERGFGLKSGPYLIREAEPLLEDTTLQDQASVSATSEDS